MHVFELKMNYIAEYSVTYQSCLIPSMHLGGARLGLASVLGIADENGAECPYFSAAISDKPSKV
jgi:hypothetical protein